MVSNHTAALHYTAPPVVGGVEAVIEAHASTFLHAGYPYGVIAGSGEAQALPEGTEFHLVPEISSRHPEIIHMSAVLDRGQVPADFDDMARRIARLLDPIVRQYGHLIVHNVMTKHFNLPLTAALIRLLEDGAIRHFIAWCHDFSWTSPNSRARMHPGYPWDMLRTYRPDITYVTVSEERRQELAKLLIIPPDRIHVVYNGVDPHTILGISDTGWSLVKSMDLLNGDLLVLMPVRVTKAKNIELAIRVAEALKNQGRNPRLIITGPPDPHDTQSMAYYQELRAMRSNLHLDQEVRFVFEIGADPSQPTTIPIEVVGELFRLFDALFMPSHREGFGMPVLEAAMAGIPVICSQNVPAAEEIGGDAVTCFDEKSSPDEIARKIIQAVEANPIYPLRKRVRRQFTWDAIFRKDILPLLQKQEALH